MPEANRSLNQIVGVFLAAWFFFALTIGVAGSFRSASPGAVTVTVWGLSAFALSASWKIPISHLLIFIRLIAPQKAPAP
jgi:hypothetical protein